MSIVRGWCPGAWTPMAAGDGLLVRVRPPLGRIAAAPLLALCAAAEEHGNGLIDLTSRAALQLRGVSEAGWPRLIERLVDVGLVDADPVREARANMLVAPEWAAGDDTHRIALDLLARLDELPDLPGKAGFAIDAGPAPVLGADPADFRIERGMDGRLILRGDGRPDGVALSPGAEVDGLIALARWFMESGGGAAKRMARHDAPLPAWATGDVRPAPAPAPLAPGRHALGAAFGLPFGRIPARDLATLVECAAALRLTPWRIAIVEGAAPRPIDGLILDPASPLLATDACTGAPACPQASVETRGIARRLAPHVAGRLHVSGCDKGCARPTPADVVLTGRDGLFDLAFAACAGDAPAATGLSPEDLLTRFGAA